MIREKSCGALVYRDREGVKELLLIKHRSGGHWSFPKGHVEGSERSRRRRGWMWCSAKISAKVWNISPSPM